MRINPRREAINECRTCDHNGLFEVVPADKHHHATLARCPHDAHEIVTAKRAAEAERAAWWANRRPSRQEALPIVEPADA